MQNKGWRKLETVEFDVRNANIVTERIYSSSRAGDRVIIVRDFIIVKTLIAEKQKYRTVNLSLIILNVASPFFSIQTKWNNGLFSLHGHDGMGKDCRDGS